MTTRICNLILFKSNNEYLYTRRFVTGNIERTKSPTWLVVNEFKFEIFRIDEISNIISISFINVNNDIKLFFQNW